MRCLLSIAVCSFIGAPTFLRKALQAARCLQHTRNCKHSHRTSGLTDAAHRKQQNSNITVTWDVPPCSLTGRGNVSHQHTATYIPDNTASQNRREQFQYLARSHRLPGYGSQHCALPVSNQNTGRFAHANSPMAAEQLASHSCTSFRVRH